MPPTTPTLVLTPPFLETSESISADLAGLALSPAQNLTETLAAQILGVRVGTVCVVDDEEDANLSLGALIVRAVRDRAERSKMELRIEAMERGLSPTNVVSRFEWIHHMHKFDKEKVAAADEKIVADAAIRQLFTLLHKWETAHTELNGTVAALEKTVESLVAENQKYKRACLDPRNFSWQ